MKIKNDLLLRTVKGEKTERPPVWLMRQAGRILPEYRALRQKVNGFKTLVTTPELVCEVTLQPVNRLGVDAAILFSDILVIPEAMGLPYTMIEKKGPYFENTINKPDDIKKIHIANADENLEYVIKGIQLLSREINYKLPLIGFAGAPFTIFTYMVEGQGSKTFSKARTFLYEHPEASHQLLSLITASTIDYLQAQIKAGVNIIQLFDSWAGILTPQQYTTYGIPYLKKICDAIQDVPKIVFAKGAYFALEEISNLPCDVIGLDWNMDIDFAKNKTANKKILQGNLDPCLLFADEKTIQSSTNKMIDQFGGKHIANLGHGVYPDTPLQGVITFIETVKNYKYQE